MYTLLSGLYKYMFQKDEYCVLILGLDNAGKTTFLEQSKTRFNKNYKGMSLSKITTTVGLNIGTVDVGKARLMFWDLGGQEELQSLWDKYYAECHGVIYVIDSTDEERLSESKRAFEKMVTSEALDGVPILVLANKQDVEASPPDLPVDPRHQDGLQRLHLQDRQARLPDPGLLGPHGVTKGCARASSGWSSASCGTCTGRRGRGTSRRRGWCRGCPQLVLSARGALLPAPCLGPGARACFALGFFICFVFSLRQIFLCP
ncbi:ADP-ribosylation factor-related protein 1 isoform X1 [Vulpes vulpes]|uniref:ADP-ribosylation factor-related protein 1 n=1 Tax=Vulpes vulpes TaxID=9627 RepID=A0ABM4YMF4_VULVU|nr:ADP-ribosylation factor-related protein 1 isoform X2 [Vulpes lagopus]